LLKGMLKDELVSIIHRAHYGLPSADASLMPLARSRLSSYSKSYNGDIPLTNREVQIVRQVALGLSNREIGRSFDISVETVKEHVQNIPRKLEAGGRTEAAVCGVKRGLV